MSGFSRTTGAGESRPFSQVPARRLTLVRHSIPDIRAEVPASQWRLSPEGLTLARAFAAQLEPGNADSIGTSTEPKAVQTAEALAEVWKLPVEQLAGLHEHERPVPRMLAREQFETTIRELFARPSELVFGAETADAARERFINAVRTVVERTDRDLLLVSHGTVIALFVAAHTDVNPFEFWKQQEMPCAVTFVLPGLTCEGITLPH